MEAELGLTQLYQDSVIITKSIIAQVEDNIRTEQEIYKHQVENLRIPNNLITLLQITRKSEIKKYIKDLSISEDNWR